MLQIFISYFLYTTRHFPCLVVMTTAWSATRDLNEIAFESILSQATTCDRNLFGRNINCVKSCILCNAQGSTEKWNVYTT